jgi:hypothetical protein
MSRIIMSWTIVLVALSMLSMLSSGCIADEEAILAGDGDSWTNAGSDSDLSGGDYLGPTGPAAPGEVGYACDGPEDCFSGWCMPSPDGMVCSKACEDTCPEGWACESVAAPFGGTALVCLHPRAFTCLPCEDNKDCNQVLSGGTNQCISYGDTGSFCGVRCSADEPCDDGYVCEAQELAGGEVSTQCVPGDGTCECSKLGAQVENKTICSVQGDDGACVGWGLCEGVGPMVCGATPPEDELCDGEDNDCDGATDEFTGGNYCENASEIGKCSGTDLCVDGVLICEGPEPTEEVCDGEDNDCDGGLDEGFGDLDENGSADCVDVDIDGDGVSNDDDCLPLNPAVYPGAPESCNLTDDDCNGVLDDKNALGCTDYFLDLDADGYGSDLAPPECLCEPNPVTYYTAELPGDCNDLLATTHPGAGDPCNGMDDNCDGTVDDEDFDLDQDGIADCLDLDDDGDGFLDGVDCAPVDKDIYPGAQEYCNDLDNDCDGQVNEEDSFGCKYYMRDVDGDGQGSNTDPPRCLCAPDYATSYTALLGGDCDDLDTEIYAGAIEICNGKNDDCDNWTDESYDNQDGDSEADCVDADDDNDGVPDDEDCAPLDKDIFPGQAEVCNGIDDGCDGLVDEANAVGCTVYWRDVDGDGYGSTNHPTLCLCAPDAALAYTATQGNDCDDLSNSKFPGATEVCNYQDDNCNGTDDEGVASPCNDCYELCVMEIGPEGVEGFNEGLGSSQGVNADAQGVLVLGTTPGSGFHRHLLEGWPNGSTLWDFLMLQVSYTGSGAWVTVRTRSGETVADVLNATWSAVHGPYPPDSFPLDLSVVANYLEVEVSLSSAVSGDTPMLEAINVIAYEE